MKLSEMKQVLAEREIQLTKSLGQNFLHDANQLRRIVAAADLVTSDKVLEIGPGLGPLTELLLQKAREVLAIETDGRLIEVLRERFRGQLGRADEQSSKGSVLRLLHEDALAYVRRERQDWSAWKLVANLPYSIASPLLVELAQADRGPERMVATLQIEVADRLSAKGGEEEYGVLSLLVQLQYEPIQWFKIAASCFFPEPEVDSACVCLLRRTQPLLAPERKAAFYRIVKRSFSQRRKMMLKLLKSEWTNAESALEQAQIPLSARAETVSLEQFVQLAQYLT